MIAVRFPGPSAIELLPSTIASNIHAVENSQGAVVGGSAAV